MAPDASNRDSNAYWQYTELRSRIAPTPSGFLHKGNGFSFVLTWVLTRLAGGSLYLRIDDADTERARPEYIEDIFRCLEWLGLDWENGPQGPDEFHQHYTQEKRFPQYQHLLDLLQQQQQLYACSCSRSQIREMYSDGIYRGSCRLRKFSFASAAYAWRLLVREREVCFAEAGLEQRCILLAQEMGDIVVRRKGGLPAYQITSLADDMAAGINYIVRGEDLLYSTAAQVYLAELLAQQQQEDTVRLQAAAFTEAQFLHHRLVLDKEGNKLSKSAGSSSLLSLRQAGGNPLPVYAMVAEYLQLPADAAASLQELLAAARMSSIARQLLGR